MNKLYYIAKYLFAIATALSLLLTVTVSWGYLIITIPCFIFTYMLFKGSRETKKQIERDVNKYLNNQNVKYDLSEWKYIKVKGVSYDNDDGVSRQSLLQKFKEEVEDGYGLDVELRKYKFKGEIAIGVYVNDEQIGNIPRERIDEVLDVWNRIEVHHCDIYGGYKDKSYGCEITIKVLKENNTFIQDKDTTIKQPNNTTVYNNTNTNSDFDYVKIKVAGVTFKNGRKSRQTLLRKIRFQDEPFDKELYIEFENYDFEGEDAIAIYVNKEQIGNVPRVQLPYILENWERITPTAIDVYGGGEGKSIGCEVTIKVQKKIAIEKS